MAQQSRERGAVARREGVCARSKQIRPGRSQGLGNAEPAGSFCFGEGRKVGLGQQRLLASYRQPARNEMQEVCLRGAAIRRK